MRDERQEIYDAWLDDRPEHVKEIAKRFPPWHQYRFKETGRPCTIYSFDEDEEFGVTLKVIAPQLWGFPDHLVFGVSPDGIERDDA